MSLMLFQNLAMSFFYEIAKRVGIDRLSATFKSIGLGEGGLEGFPHCKKGLVPTKEWKKDKKKCKLDSK